ncbi:unnamed protein product, partial [marine sediment metagenome]
NTLPSKGSTNPAKARKTVDLYGLQNHIISS